MFGRFILLMISTASPFSIAVHKKSMLLFISHETGLIRLKNNDLFQWSVAPFVALSVASSGVCFLVWFFQKLKHTPPIMMISYTAAADDDTSYFYFSKPLLIPIWSILRIQSPPYNRIYIIFRVWLWFDPDVFDDNWNLQKAMKVCRK